MPVKTGSPPGMSIVVAVRNEEENIRTLVRELSGMAFPKEKFEVIIVNDHSSDATVKNLELSFEELTNFRLVELAEGKEGKKEALQFGIEQACFEIIATTDADCTFSKNWLTCVSSYFEQAETKMVVGGVKLIGDHSFFSQLQVTEFESLMGSTAAAIGLGHPMMCNGANLAFRKSAFVEVGGYADNMQIASGDDEFLMRKIVRRYPNGIRFLNYYEAIVTSNTQKRMQEFYHQRLRWAGKWRHNTDLVTKLVAVLVFVSHLAFLGLVGINLMGGGGGGTFGLPIAKLFLEGVFIYWVSRFLHLRFNPIAFLSLQFIYPLYVTVIALFSLFSRYQWRGRNYK